MSDAANDAEADRQAKRGPAVDLKSMTPAQLLQLAADVENELRDKRESTLKNLRAKWDAEAKEHGVTMAEVLGTVEAGQGRKVRKDGGAKRAVKFRDPETGAGWSGVGRVPTWLDTLEKQGRKRTEFLL